MSATEHATTLFSNVRVFDGQTAMLSQPSSVLVRGPIIDRISSPPIGPAPGEQRTEIDTGGRVLMPALVDAHRHAMLASLPLKTVITADLGYINFVAGQQAKRTLLRGFTTVRDTGGPVFGLKQAIDDGTVEGPRIYPSGAFITQTSDHGDFRMRHEVWAIHW
jgi:imidazolonepropionase-like amidohydrolase